MTRKIEPLSDLRQQRADVKQRLEEASKHLATLQAELAMVDYRIASHRDYRPQVQRPIFVEQFDNGKVIGLPREHQKTPRKVLDLDGLDLEDLDFS